jgi:SRSO17 transposase
LFLPDEWIDEPERCLKAGVPKKVIVKKTKIDLALDMVRESIDSGVRFGWVTADGLYGQSYNFCSTIEDLGKDFVVDIHKDQHVYLSDPCPYLPEATSGRGRKPTLRKTDHTPVEVSQYLDTLTNTVFKEVNLRKGTKGWITAKVHVAKVWVWDGKQQNARERTLIIRKGNKKKKEPVKFALSNLKAGERSIQQFAFMQGQRFFIERAFEDCKGELGMADYQVRKYNAWYHHQALVIIAMDYVNKQRLEYQHNIPLLSVRDVRLQIIAMLKEQGVQMEPRRRTA